MEEREVNRLGVLSSERAKSISKRNNIIRDGVFEMAELILPHHHESDGKIEQLNQCLRRTEHFQAVADVFRQLADSSRIRIFWLLCHCEECVLDISALMEMSSPAVSHHLRQLKDSGLIVSRRRGREVCYRASDSEQAQLLHVMIEKTMAIACPEDGDIARIAPRKLSPDERAGAETAQYPQEQVEIVRRVHEMLTADLSSRVTIDELSRRFHIKPSTLKALFKAVYGNSIAAHVREHRMERAAALLRDGDDSVTEISRAVGYESPSKFTAEFRKVYEMLPTEYRRLARRDGMNLHI